MADAGTKYTEAAIRAMERRFRAIYREAQTDIISKLNAHTAALYAKDAAKRAQLEAGTITKQEYDSWLNGQVFRTKQWKDKIDSVATSLLYANQQANAIVEGKKRAVFGENATFQAYSIENQAGMDLSFGIYDSATVTRLIKEEPELLPRKVVNGKKDTAWNKTNIARAITQGVIQGESIPQIAQRIAKQTSSENMKAMTRYARTAMTGAQNAGRMAMLDDAQEMGIKVKKKWLATLDKRTRDAHQDLDGQVQDVDKPFESELGPIMYPGDPKAHPGNIWNCRCTLIYEYQEYMPKNAQRRAYNEDRTESKVVPDMTYREWKARKNEKNQFTNDVKNGIIKQETGGVYLDLQLFAEDDLKKQRTSSLQKGIESLREQIAAHKEKINNPQKYPDWEYMSDERRKRRIRHWEHEIKVLEQNIENRIQELKRRGEWE